MDHTAIMGKATPNRGAVENGVENDKAQWLSPPGDAITNLEIKAFRRNLRFRVSWSARNDSYPWRSG
jgi:hypothetical protein